MPGAGWWGSSSRGPRKAGPRGQSKVSMRSMGLKASPGFRALTLLGRFVRSYTKRGFSLPCLVMVLPEFWSPGLICSCDRVSRASISVGETSTRICSDKVSEANVGFALRLVGFDRRFFGGGQNQVMTECCAIGDSLANAAAAPWHPPSVGTGPSRFEQTGFTGRWLFLDP